MKATAATAGFLKQLDIAAQVIVFCLMTYLMFFCHWGPFAMFLMAGIQYLSSLLWLIGRQSRIPYPARKSLEIVFISLGSFLILCWMGRETTILGSILGVMMYTLIFLGPVLGIWYFIVSVNELRFYRRVSGSATFR